MSTSGAHGREEQKGRLFRIFLETSSTNAMMDELGNLLGMPVMAVTKTWQLVAYSAAIPSEDKDWNQIIRLGHYPDYLIDDIVNHLWPEGSHTAGPPFEYRYQQTGAVRTICNMHYNGRHMGALVALHKTPDKDQVDIELFQTATQMVAKVLALTSATLQQNIAESILMDIIQGKLKNRHLPYSQITEGEFGGATHFMLISVDSVTRTIDPVWLIRNLDTLRSIFPNGTIFHYNTQVLVFLTAERPVEIHGECRDRLSRLMTDLQCFACMSDGFEDLNELEEHYQKNLRAAKLSRLIKNQSPFVVYDNFKFVDMFLLACSSTRMQNRTMFVTKKAMEIYRYDRQNGTDYLNTLWCYINAKESLSAAAKRLYVHRNTVVYRIARIKELFEIQFESFETLFQLYYSCSILRFYNVMSGNGVDIGDLEWDAFGGESDPRASKEPAAGDL